MFKFCISCGHNHSLVEDVEKTWNHHREDWDVRPTKNKARIGEWDCVRLKGKECSCTKLIPRRNKGMFS